MVLVWKFLQLGSEYWLWSMADGTSAISADFQKVARRHMSLTAKAKQFAATRRSYVQSVRRIRAFAKRRPFFNLQKITPLFVKAAYFIRDLRRARL